MPDSELKALGLMPHDEGDLDLGEEGEEEIDEEEIEEEVEGDVNASN